MRSEELGVLLIFAGFMTMFAGAAVLMLSSQSGEVSVGGCIAIPIPICFGVGPMAPWLILASLLVLALLIPVMVLLAWLLFREAPHRFSAGAET